VLDSECSISVVKQLALEFFTGYLIEKAAQRRQSVSVPSDLFARLP